MWLRKHRVFAALLSVVALAATGSLVTRVTVSDGLGQYTGRARVAAEEALVQVQVGCLDHPLARLLLAQRLRVVHVRLLDTTNRTGERQSSDSALRTIESSRGNVPQFEALVRGYSFFSVPTVTMAVTDHSGRCW